MAAESEARCITDRLSELQWSEVHVSSSFWERKMAWLAVNLSRRAQPVACAWDKFTSCFPGWAHAGLARYNTRREGRYLGGGMEILNRAKSTTSIPGGLCGWMIKALLFIGSDGLYSAKGPDYEPILVQPGFLGCWDGQSLIGEDVKRRDYLVLYELLAPSWQESQSLHSYWAD